MLLDAYMNAARLARWISLRSWTRIWLHAYIRRLQASLRALMEFAKNDLCYLARSKRTASIRFTFLRTNLSRHHTVIDLRNQSGHSCLIPRFLRRFSCYVIFPISALMRE